MSKLFFKHQAFMDVCFCVEKDDGVELTGVWWSLGQVDPYPIKRDVLIVPAAKRAEWSYQVGNEPLKEGEWRAL